MKSTKALTYYLHQSYTASFKHTYYFMKDSDWPFWESIPYLFIFAIKSSMNTSDFIKTANLRLFEETGGFAQRLSNQNNNHVTIEIAKSMVQLKKILQGEKFFGGDEANYADVEIFGLLNFVETYDPEGFENLKSSWVLEKWYSKMKEIIQKNQT